MAKVYVFADEAGDSSSPGPPVPVGTSSWALFTVTNGTGILGFSPRKGPVGTVVTIKGIRFSGATKVKFNGLSAAFTVDSDSKIMATVPAGATTGQIKIVTPTGKAGSGPDFEVT